MEDIRSRFLLARSAAQMHMAAIHCNETGIRKDEFRSSALSMTNEMRYIVQVDQAVDCPLVCMP